MTEQTFHADVLAAEDTTRIVLRGAFDLGAAPRFREIADRLRDEGVRSVVVDLRELEFLDSSGLGELIRLDTTARQDGLDLRIVRPPEQVGMTFALAGLEEHFTWVDAPAPG